MTETLYKWLTEEGHGTYSGYAWPLPTDDAPGDWVRVEGPLVPCENGVHLCREGDLPHWINDTLYEAECRGERLGGDRTEIKVVVREARLLRRIPQWDTRAAHRFACDCAERAASLVRARFPDDRRVDDCIAAARRYATGEASIEELHTARAAVGRGYAADAAAHAADAVTAAVGAARGVLGHRVEGAAAHAHAAAASAVGAAHAAAAAVGSEQQAMRRAERRWQARRLMQHIRGEVAEAATANRGGPS